MTQSRGSRSPHTIKKHLKNGLYTILMSMPIGNINRYRFFLYLHIRDLRLRRNKWWYGWHARHIQVQQHHGAKSCPSLRNVILTHT